ncbi:MAG: hypothetical protein MJZ31_02860 [Bacteroidales bacterium]|nr:hypothetical protein [Bacteroidales bacterium]
MKYHVYYDRIDGGVWDEYINVPFTREELREMFCCFDPLVLGVSDPKRLAFIQWIKDRYVPMAKEITSIIEC